MAVTIEKHATVGDAQRALGGDAVYLGGGTILMREINAGLVQGRIIRSTDPVLKQIRQSGDGFEIGAGVTMSALANHAELAFLHPVVRAIGGPQIRNMATIGGNLFAEPPYGDLAAALLALGARLVMAGGQARPIEEFFRDRKRAGLITAIQLPRPRDSKSFAFHKVSRVKPKGVSVMSFSALLPRDAGRLRGVRIACIGLGPGPLRAFSAERALEGQVLDAASITRAAQLVTDGSEPPTDALASSWYRREVAGVHLKRLLERMI
ncbi:MAG: FAD binding domain-containing protein [Roseomonas sp.]|jgi:CO/xanthine dehydrogenase FAD-binding subunit|nr:FAD binding domain-containing protein [Roseomonas sp.]MCA3371764.1 FAD binding domain-containing protein [Roseomonas sp.]MCE2761883.1 FAD binding domain-containing protein [Acetobacteraceae bacterium]